MGGPGSGRRSAGSPSDASAREALPAWVPHALFAGITVLLFREFIFSDLMLVGQDTFSLGYVARAFFADALRTTGFPLWNPQILGGTPFLESLAGGDSLYPPSLLLLFVTETYRALGWKLILHVFLAGSFMYAWIRMIGGSREGALLAGLAYLLAPYLVSLVLPGHDGKLFVTALTPLLFAATEWMVSRRDFASGAALGAVVMLVILTTHFQMAYFLFGAVGVYAGFRCVQLARAGDGRSWAARRFAIFLVFSLAGAGAAGVQLIPAVAYVTEHSRRTMTTTESGEELGVAYSSSWSLHPEEAVSLVVPEFVGNSGGGAEWTSGTYWGRNAFKTNHEYLGLVALLLATLSFMGAPRSGLRWFFVALGATAFLFAMGAHTPVWRLFYEVLPGISLFRAPSMAIFLTGFSLATLVALGFDRGLVLVSEGKGSAIVRALGLPTGLLLLGWVLAQTGALTGLWLTFFSPDLTEAGAQALEAAEPHMTRGFLVATVLAAVTCATWWAMGRGFLNAAGGLALIGLLIVVDEWRVDQPFIQTVEFESFAQPNGNLQFLAERAASEEPFRVLSLTRGGQDVTPGMHGLELAGGHHPNDLARYRQLIGMAGSGLPTHLTPPFHANIPRMLNIRYLIWPDVEYGPLEQYTNSEALTPVSRLEFSDGSTFSTVYSFPGLPRARLVGEAIVVAEDQVMDVILDEGAYDPAVQTVLTEPPPLELGGGAVEGTVEWIEREPDRLLLDVNAAAPALLVIADNWFPAWKAWVDGAQSEVLRADHTLRAVPIPEGSHRVELRYSSSLLSASLVASILSALFLALVAGIGFARRGAPPPDSPAGRE